MRIEMNDARARLYRDLLDATGERAKSKALDRAARFYIEMRGGTTARPRGTFAILLDGLDDHERLKRSEVEQIADLLDTDELPIRYDVEVELSIGNE